VDEISSLEACGDVVSRRGSLEAFELLFARIIPFDRRHGAQGKGARFRRRAAGEAAAPAGSRARGRVSLGAEA